MIDDVLKEIAAYRWRDPERQEWLGDLHDRLRRFAPAARNGDCDALHRICWIFGSIVEPPSWTREDEEKRRRDRRRDQRKFGRSSVTPVGRSQTPDTKALNRFAVRLAKAYGVFKLLPDGMSAMHARGAEDPLFTPDAWRRWRHWSSEFLWNKRNRPRKERRMRRARERQMVA